MPPLSVDLSSPKTSVTISCVPPVGIEALIQLKHPNGSIIDLHQFMVTQAQEMYDVDENFETVLENLKERGLATYQFMIKYSDNFQKKAKTF